MASAGTEAAADDDVVAFAPCDFDLAAVEFGVFADDEDGIAVADGDAGDDEDVFEGFAGDVGADPCADFERGDFAGAPGVGVLNLGGDVELAGAGVDAAGGADDAALPCAGAASEVGAEGDFGA